MFFEQVKQGEIDPIFGLVGAFAADPRACKVNLLVGVYLDDALQMRPLRCVEETRIALAAQYLPIDGFPPFIEAVGELCFGPRWTAFKGRVYGAQALGGTGALRLGADFFVQEVSDTVFLPDLTWPNHPEIFRRAGAQIHRYPTPDSARMKAELHGKRGVVVLHAACHNPTGLDFSDEEWIGLAKWFRTQQLLPFFDFAYQGFGRGITADRRALELFAEQGCEFAVAYSCSKNFGLYGERVGALLIVAGEARDRVGSQVKRIIRAMYSNPPSSGAKVVAQVLSERREMWELEVAAMRARLDAMRAEFLSQLGTRSDLKLCRGMFLYLGLSDAQVERLRHEFAVYVPAGGRINVAGLNRHNLQQVVQAVRQVCNQ